MNCHEAKIGGATMTAVFELPPEPPVGTRIEDRDGYVWQRKNFTWVNNRKATPFQANWGHLIGNYAPLTVLGDPISVPAERLTVVALSKAIRAAKNRGARRNSEAVAGVVLEFLTAPREPREQGDFW